jgi:hypothetical protein
MLICVILRIAISTGTKNHFFVSRQNKLADAPVPANSNSGPPSVSRDRANICSCVCRFAFLLEIMTNNSYILFLISGFCSVGGSLRRKASQSGKRSLGMVLAGYALRNTRYKKWPYV